MKTPSAAAVVELVAVVAVAVLSGTAWFLLGPGEDAAIRRRLDAFCAEANTSTSDGLGTVARAASLGSYFTDDIVVDLGKGSAPISGRETIIGMAARL